MVLCSPLLPSCVLNLFPSEGLPGCVQQTPARKCGVLSSPIETLPLREERTMQTHRFNDGYLLRRVATPQSDSAACLLAANETGGGPPEGRRSSGNQRGGSFCSCPAALCTEQSKALRQSTPPSAALRTPWASALPCCCCCSLPRLSA